MMVLEENNKLIIYYQEVAMESITQLNSEELININGGNLAYDAGHALGSFFRWCGQHYGECFGPGNAMI